MKNYKGFITFLALILIVIPGLSFADGIYYYGNQGINEAAPVKTVGTVVSQNGGSVYTVGTTTDNSANNILGINFKSKAERDAEKAAADAAAARAAEEARVAKNNDGSFAYGYTNGNGAQYSSGARYVDARTVNGSRYTASAGSATGSGFLPTTFGGWLIAIILMAMLVAIVRAFSEKFNKKQAVHAHAH